MQDGWIKMYRKTEENPIVCKDNDYFRLWHHLLYNANHSSQPIIFNNKKIMLKPGQYITGRKKIAEKCNITESKVERILKWFETDHQIEQQTCSQGRLITVLNWEMYQTFEQQTARQLTDIQTLKQQLTIANKNDKNVKNDKNERNNNIIINIYDFVEQNFGRTLSPIEYEEINLWNDTELTRYAIKQAVLNNKCGTKYISRILNAYERENIKTVQQAQERERQYIEAKKVKVNKPKYKTATERTQEVFERFLAKGEE